MNIEIVSLEDGASKQDITEWRPLLPRLLSGVGPASFGYAPRLRSVLSELKPDVIHVQGLWGYQSIAARQCAEHLSVPCLVSPRGMLDAWALANSRWKKRLAAWLYENKSLRRAACLHALCQREAHSMRAYGLRNPICVLPNGVDIPATTAYSTEAAPALRSIRESGRKVVLFLGRVHPKKGLVNLVKAWAEIQKPPAGSRNSAWVLAIAGWDQGGHEAKLKELATELAVPWADARDHGFHPTSGLSLVFLGPRFSEAKVACYSQCDAFILPSFSEGLPMAVLEAWSYGKPVLITPECNLEEAFAVGVALRIETSVEGIAAGLRNLHEMSRSELSAMGARGRDFVTSRYAWLQISREMMSVYRWLLGGGQKPDCMTFG